MVATKGRLVTKGCPMINTKPVNKRELQDHNYHDAQQTTKPKSDIYHYIQTTEPIKDS